MKSGPFLHGQSVVISILVHLPWQRGVKMFLKRVRFPSAPWPWQRPPRWPLWALLSHCTQTVLPARREEKRREVRVMFSLASFVSVIFTIAKIISVLLVSTRLHGFVNSKDNTICLAFFCRVGSQIGPHVVIFRAGRSIFSWQEHGSFWKSHIPRDPIYLSKRLKKWYTSMSGYFVQPSFGAFGGFARLFLL